MRFSKRTEWNTDESDLALAHRERLASGLPIADLTASNPTRCGFAYPSNLLAPLSDSSALDYDPDPKGSLQARQAVCSYYRDIGVLVEPSQILLTTSTSEAYGYLLKLLCNPGDAILVPQPSYPLFDFLASSEVVRLIYVPLIYDFGWQLDLQGLRRKITSGTRAVVLVNPNNPTGHFIKKKEANELAEICREHDLALIVDEVFLDYKLTTSSLISDPGIVEDRTSFAARSLDIPVFIVSGISKICGLPQMKAAWILAIGPGTKNALERLEVLADIYLSMNAPIQRALPHWLDSRQEIQDQIRNRVLQNLSALDKILATQSSKLIANSPRDGGVLANRLEVEGGWYAVLRIPAIQPDIVTVHALLNSGVWVHPGYFFGMRESGWLVLSLLPRPDEFALGVELLMTYLHRNQESYHEQ